MNMTVIRSITVTDGEASYCGQVGQLWNEIRPRADRVQGSASAVYDHYRKEHGQWAYRISAGYPDPGGSVPLQDGGNYRIYEGKKKGITGIYELWSRVWRDEKAGILKRRRALDYEWYRTDGTVCLGISVFPGGRL